MRSAIIITTCALATLAAPIFKSSGSGCVAISGGKCISENKRDVQLDTRSPSPAPFGRGSHPRDVEEREEKKFEARSPLRLSRPKNSRGLAQEDELETRSPAPAPFGRGSHPRDVGNGEEDIEARDIQNEDKRSVREHRNVNEDIDFRAGVGRRDAEANPFSRNHDSYRREAEANPFSRNHDSYRREAEAEPYSRNHASYRREAEAEPFSRNHDSYRRDAAQEQHTVRPSK